MVIFNFEIACRRRCLFVFFFFFNWKKFGWYCSIFSEVYLFNSFTPSSSWLALTAQTHTLFKQRKVLKNAECLKLVD